jgi:hypothetical protein
MSWKTKEEIVGPNLESVGINRIHSSVVDYCLFHTSLNDLVLKLRGFGPLAKYADRATAASWISSANFCG